MAGFDAGIGGLGDQGRGEFVEVEADLFGADVPQLRQRGVVGAVQSHELFAHHDGHVYENMVGLGGPGCGGVGGRGGGTRGVDGQEDGLVGAGRWILDHQYGRGAGADETFGGAAQQRSGEPAGSVRADDQQVGVAFPGEGADGGGDLTGPDHALDVAAAAAQMVRQESVRAPRRLRCGRGRHDLHGGEMRVVLAGELCSAAHRVGRAVGQVGGDQDVPKRGRVHRAHDSARRARMRRTTHFSASATKKTVSPTPSTFAHSTSVSPAEPNTVWKNDV